MLGKSKHLEKAGTAVIISKSVIFHAFVQVFYDIL